jgi:hypothetical protein
MPYPAATRPISLVILAVLAAACEQTQDLGVDRDGGPALPGEGDGDGDGDGDEPTGDGDGDPFDLPVVTHTTREVCDKLLDCADGQFPSQYGDFFPIYGTNGSCFSARSEAACRQECVDAMLGMECGYCDDDTNCSGGRCHPTYHYCVGCLGDADCSESDVFVYCDPSALGCAACVEDAHCAWLDDPECPFDKPTCSGSCYDHEFQGQVGFTLRGTGLTDFEGNEVEFYFEYQNEDAICHNDIGYPWLDDDQEPTITLGAFEVVEEDYLPIPGTLSFSVHDGMRAYKFEKPIQPNGTSHVVIEVTRADFVAL